MPEEYESEADRAACDFNAERGVTLAERSVDVSGMFNLKETLKDK